MAAANSCITLLTIHMTQVPLSLYSNLGFGLGFGLGCNEWASHIGLVGPILVYGLIHRPYTWGIIHRGLYMRPYT